MVDAVTQPGGARDKAQNGTLTTTSAKRELTRISSKRRSVSRYIKKRDFRGFPLQDKFVQFPHSTPVGSDHQDPSYRWYLGIGAVFLVALHSRPRLQGCCAPRYTLHRPLSVRRRRKPTKVQGFPQYLPTCGQLAMRPFPLLPCSTMRPCSQTWTTGFNTRRRHP